MSYRSLMASRSRHFKTLMTNWSALPRTLLSHHHLRLCIELTCLGKTFRALCDTGSGTELMSNTLANDLGLTRRKLPTPLKVGLAISEGPAPKPLTECVSATFSHGGTQSNFQETVLQLADLGGNYDVILGSPFLSRHNWDVSARNRCIFQLAEEKFIFDYRLLSSTQCLREVCSVLLPEVEEAAKRLAAEDGLLK